MTRMSAVTVETLATWLGTKPTPETAELVVQAIESAKSLSDNAMMDLADSTGLASVGFFFHTRDIVRRSRRAQSAPQRSSGDARAARVLTTMNSDGRRSARRFS